FETAFEPVIGAERCCRLPAGAIARRPVCVAALPPLPARLALLGERRDSLPEVLGPEAGEPQLDRLALLALGQAGEGDESADHLLVSLQREGRVGGDLVNFEAIKTVEGAGSLWTTAGEDLKIGAGGTGRLIVQDQGQVQSSDLYVGYSSSGTLDIAGGGLVQSSDLYVGYSGPGTLNLDGGGLVQSSDVYVGYSSSGTLNLDDGGRVESTRGYIGYDDETVGTVVARGVGSGWTTTGSLYVGQSPSIEGSLVLEDDSSVDVGGLLEIARGSTVKVAGGRLTAGGLSGEGWIDFRSGTIEITGGDLSVGSRPVGSSLTLGTSDVVDVSGKIAVDVAASLNAWSASLDCQEFDNAGYASLSGDGSLTAQTSVRNRGVLTLAGGAITAPQVTNDFGASMSAKGAIEGAFANHGALSLTGVLAVSGTMTNDGTIEIDAAASLAQSAGLDNAGVIEMHGGAILGAGTVVNLPGDIIRGEGAIASDLDNNGGLIHANGSSLLSLANLING
ncbi:hypothetical protein LCGC14_2485740, partial [marine sediment metagenome]